MPYIKPEERDQYQQSLYYLSQAIVGRPQGHLTYLLMKLMVLWTMSEGTQNVNYSRLSQAVASAQDAAHEFRRQFLDPYEDEKKTENGNI